MVYKGFGGFVVGDWVFWSEFYVFLLVLVFLCNYLLIVTDGKIYKVVFCWVFMKINTKKILALGALAALAVGGRELCTEAGRRFEGAEGLMPFTERLKLPADKSYRTENQKNRFEQFKNEFDKGLIYGFSGGFALLSTILPLFYISDLESQERNRNRR